MIEFAVGDRVEIEARRWRGTIVAMKAEAAQEQLFFSYKCRKLGLLELIAEAAAD